MQIASARIDLGMGALERRETKDEPEPAVAEAQAEVLPPHSSHREAAYQTGWAQLLNKKKSAKGRSCKSKPGFMRLARF